MTPPPEVTLPTVGWSDVDFSLRGTKIAAWLFGPRDIDADEPRPCIVMAHGFSGVRDQRLPAFAERFADAGYRALVFDYRNFGDSEGEPRQLLDIKGQLADWRAAVHHARTMRGVDPERIVVWGTSFSGGHAITIAAEDHRVAAAVAQGPFADGPATLLSYGPRQGSSLVGPALRDAVRGLRHRAPLLLPAVGAPESNAIIVTPDAVSGFAGVTGPNSRWRNEVAARVGLQVSLYRPIRRAPDVACPILFCLATRDVVTPSAIARKAADAAPRSEVKEYDAQHFDVYVGDTFAVVVADQLEFLTRHVPATGHP